MERLPGVPWTPKSELWPGQVCHRMLTAPAVQIRHHDTALAVSSAAAAELACHRTACRDQALVAVAGKGLYRNSDHGRKGTMVALWSRTLPALKFKQLCLDCVGGLTLSCSVHLCTYK